MSFKSVTMLTAQRCSSVNLQTDFKLWHARSPRLPLATRSEHKYGPIMNAQLCFGFWRMILFNVVTRLLSSFWDMVPYFMQSIQMIHPLTSDINCTGQQHTAGQI